MESWRRQRALRKKMRVELEDGLIRVRDTGSMMNHSVVLLH